MFVEWDGKQYVCFNQKTGEIYSIGPNKEDGYQYIEVTEEEIAPIKSYKEKMTDYTVAYNRRLKKFVLKKLVQSNDNTDFRQIPKLNENVMYDVMLEVDKKRKKCYINTDIELLDTMKETNVDIGSEISFSFTKLNDPHVLYGLVKFNLNSKDSKKIELPDSYSVYTDSDMANCVFREV